MPELLLMRHAKSSWAMEGLADHDRPLNERGTAAAAAMGRHFADAGIVPDHILVSTACRTRETIAGVIAANRHWPPPLFDDRLYAAPSARITAILRETPIAVGRVLLVGHNPGMLMLATAWGGADAWSRVGKFPTGAVATIAIDGPWAEAATGRLTGFVRPRDL